MTDGKSSIFVIENYLRTGIKKKDSAATVRDIDTAAGVQC